nr:hypothetical protein BgiMline_009595 [Biomphalaria glabrata]
MNMDQTDFIGNSSSFETYPGETGDVAEEEILSHKILVDILQKKFKLQNEMVAKAYVFKSESCIPVHVGERGIEPTDVVSETLCSLDHPYLMKKNLSAYNLAQLDDGATCADLDFKAASNFQEQYDPDNSYVALLVDANEYTLYRVMETLDNPNLGSNFCTLTCENVPLKIFKILQTIVDQLTALRDCRKKSSALSGKRQLIFFFLLVIDRPRMTTKLSLVPSMFASMQHYYKFLYHI